MMGGTNAMHSDTDEIIETILALEHGALERWNKGDVEGCIELYAEDVTYFDPITESRIDGLPKVAEYFRTYFAGKLDIPRYEILNPQVITDGTWAVLTYNLANYVVSEDGFETAGTPWNSTQVYRRTGDQWRVVHVHWSFTKHLAAAQGLMA
jgi:ketosteroid isomerase-like protein